MSKWGIRRYIGDLHSFYPEILHSGPSALELLQTANIASSTDNICYVLMQYSNIGESSGLFSHISFTLKKRGRTL